MIECNEAKLNLICRLCAEGFAESRKVAFYASRGDAQGLQDYLSMCIQKKYARLVRSDIIAAKAEEASFAEKWVIDVLEQCSHNKQAAKQRLSELKEVFEKLGLVEEVRQAWKRNAI